MKADVAYKPTEDKTSGWDDYEIKGALRTLTEADKIRRNKPLLRAVKAEAKKQLASVTKTVASL